MQSVLPHGGILPCSVQTAAKKKTATRPMATPETDTLAEEEIAEDAEESESDRPDSYVESSAAAPKKHSSPGKLLTVRGKNVN